MSTTKIIGLRVTMEFDRAIRVAAAKRDLSRSAFIRRALVKQLAELSESQHGDGQGAQASGDSGAAAATGK